MITEPKSVAIHGIHVLTFISIVFIFILMPLGAGNAIAQQGGPITIWGQVYYSDGSPVGPEHDGAYAAVIIEHAGEKTTHYDDKGGLEDGYYTVTIPEGGWSQGDTYWVVIDGDQWGDLPKHEAEGIKITPEQDVENSGTNHWILSGPSNVRRDVMTLEDEPSKFMNLEPIIAGFCALIIAIIGVVFLIVLDRQKLSVIITMSMSEVCSWFPQESC